MTPAPDWQALYTQERLARLDAEASLRGQRAIMVAALICGLVVMGLTGCIQATNAVSRAVAAAAVSPPK